VNRGTCTAATPTPVLVFVHYRESVLGASHLFSVTVKASLSATVIINRVQTFGICICDLHYVGLI